MNTNRTVLRFTGMQKLVTKSSARLDDVLGNGHVTTEILEKFYRYWNAEVEASRQLLANFTDTSPNCLPGDVMHHEINRRHEIARDQLRLYQQEYELQSSLEDCEPV